MGINQTVYTLIKKVNTRTWKGFLRIWLWFSCWLSEYNSVWIFNKNVCSKSVIIIKYIIHTIKISIWSFSMIARALFQTATKAWLNKQSRTADKGWPSSLGVGRWLTIPHRKKRKKLRNVTKVLGIGWILWNDLRHGKWIWDLERGMLRASIGQGLWRQYQEN
jgi:hypothetical protein